MKHLKTILALTLVVASVLAIAVPAMAADWSSWYGDEELYTNSGTHTHIMHLQADLNAYGGYGLSVDGYFGQLTKAAVISFQTDTGLTADGRVGPITKSALWSWTH
jgi:peptidoglycan hydrolase-like protein with peptidoglycan-binding domain